MPTGKIGIVKALLTGNYSCKTCVFYGERSPKQCGFGYGDEKVNNVCPHWWNYREDLKSEKAKDNFIT